MSYFYDVKKQSNMYVEVEIIKEKFNTTGDSLNIFKKEIKDFINNNVEQVIGTRILKDYYPKELRRTFIINYIPKQILTV